MGPISKLSLALLFIPGLCFAQAQTPIDTSGWTPPPLVDAPDAPRAPPPATAGPATPPPPGYGVPPPSTVTVPGATGYGSTYTPGLTPGLTPGSSYTPGLGTTPGAYSSYGLMAEPPPKEPEVGLMVSESLFGMLTSAGTALIPYYLLIKPLSAGGTGIDPTLLDLVFVLTFSAVPLAVSQTELSLANGSRYYISEGWPAALGGLLGQAAVFGVYYLVRPSMIDGGEAVLLIGTVAFVPVVEMVAINLFKQPRYKAGASHYGMGGLVQYTPEDGLQAGLPTPNLIPSRGGGFANAGLGITLLGGRF